MNKTASVNKKIISVILAALMVLSMIPTYVFADDTCTEHIDESPIDGKCDKCGAAMTDIEDLGGLLTDPEGRKAYFSVSDFQENFGYMWDPSGIDTIVLLADIPEGSHDYRVLRNMTFDLNGHTISSLIVGYHTYNEETGEITHSASGNLTIRDSVGTGAVTDGVQVFSSVTDGDATSTLTVEGGTLGVENGYVGIELERGTVTINGGTVWDISGYNGSGTINVNGGSIKYLSSFNAYYNDETGEQGTYTLNINGGRHSGHWNMSYDAVYNITAGEFDSVLFSDPVTQPQTVFISGGTFEQISTRNSTGASASIALSGLLKDGYAFYSRNPDDPTGQTYDVCEDATSTNTLSGVTVKEHTHTVVDGKCTGCGESVAISLTTADGMETGYGTFAEAWAAAIANEGSTLKLLGNIDLGQVGANEAPSVASGTFTLDLNNFTLSADSSKGVINVSGSAKLTVKNGKLENTSTTGAATKSSAITLMYNGYAELENVELIGGSAYDGEQACSAIVNAGTLYIADSTFNGALRVYSDLIAKIELKIKSATLNNGIEYIYDSKDYDGLKGFFADGCMLFDGNGKYIDLTSDAYWSVGTSSATFKYADKAIVKSHEHTLVDGVCSECDYACPHNSGNEREASYFQKAICSVCHAEYGDYVEDTVLPTCEIKVEDRTWWQSILNTISFGTFFKDDVTVTISATDDSYNQPGFDETKAVKVEYLVSTEALTPEAVMAGSFSEYTEPFGLSDENQYVVYAKLTDHAGNVAYVSTDGFEIDRTIPVIENMTDGGHYSFCKETIIKIDEKNVDKVTLDGAEKTLNDDNQLYIRAYNNVEQTLTVTDKAGNTLTVYIAGYTSHEIDEETLTCRHCGLAASAKLTADDYTGYFGTVSEALDYAITAYKYENIVVTLLRNVDYGDPAASTISLPSCSTSFTLDLNGYYLGGGDIQTIGGYHGTMTVISSVPGGALLMDVYMQSEDAALVMGEGLKHSQFTPGIWQYSGNVEIHEGNYDILKLNDSDKKSTKLYGGFFCEISISTEGITCADLLAPEYRYEGISYEDAKAADELQEITVVPCTHDTLDENGYCTGCGFHLVLSVEKDGVIKNFETLETAIRYAEQDENVGCTVKLMQDLVIDDATAGSLLGGYSLVFGEGEYTLDLNGKTLNINNYYFNVYYGCIMTIIDSVGGGKVTDPGMGRIGTDEYSKLTVTGGEFNTNIQISKQSSLLLKGGSFKSILAKRSASCTPFGFIADGYTFANSDGSGYANESKVGYQGGDYYITDVTVVPVPLDFDVQIDDVSFYLTSRDDVKTTPDISAFPVDGGDDKIYVTLEKTDGTEVETKETVYSAFSAAFDLSGFTVEDSGNYRIKFEYNGYIGYSNNFRITVSECLHPEYDKNTHECTQCGCEIAAVIENGGTSRGYVTFAEALAAAQTDENKGCTLIPLFDVNEAVAAKSGAFIIDATNITFTGKLNVSKGVDLTVVGGTVMGNVICVKGGRLSAFYTAFDGTINCVGDGDFMGCNFADTVSAKGGMKLSSCTITADLSVSGNAEADDCIVNGAVAVNNGGSLKSTNDTYESTVNVKSGGTLEINSICNNKLTAEEGSKLTVSGGLYEEVGAENNVDFTISGGEFTNVTVIGQLLIDCLAEGKALKDINIDDVIDGRVRIAGPVQVVDHTHSCEWKTATHEKLCGCGYVEAVDTEAPVISGIENYAEYYGPTEFTVTDENDFTVWLDGEEITLENGKYTVQPDNREHTITATDIAGNTVTYRVNFFKIYNVTLPTGAGYTIELVSNETTVRHGYTYGFIVKINNGYSKTENFKVLVNGNKLDEWDSDANSASFAVRNVSEDLVITVEGIEDITAPEVEVDIHGNTFKDFVNRITFGLFFKQSQAVKVKARDFGSGVNKVEYLLSETAFADKNSITGNWTELELNDNDEVYFNIGADQKAFVYVRVTDNSGNIAVVNSEGVVIYTDAVAISDTKTFLMGTENDIAYNLNMNGNTVSSAFNGADELDAEDYFVPNNNTFTLRNSYLSTLAAGEYTISLIFKPMGESYVDNYGNDAPSEVFLRLTVAKKTPVHDHKSSDGKIYDGKPIGTPTFNTDSDGARTFEYKRADEDDAAYTTVAPKDVGSYVIRITTAETDTFNAASSTMEFEIQPKDVTISNTAVSDKVYDGTADANIISAGAVNGLADGDDVTIVSGNAVFDDKNVGTDKRVTFSGFSLSGDDASNYTLVSQPSAVTANITAREITINGTAVKPSKVYDSTDVAEITDIGTLSENFDGEDLKITEGTAAYSDKNVGKGKTVTFSGFVLSGSAAGNYTLASQPADTTADITVKEITINGATVEATKVYDGTDVAEIANVGTPSVSYDGDDLTVVKGEAQYDNKNVGTAKTVTFSGFKLSGADASNYKLTEQPTDVTADITAKEIRIVGTAVEASKVYDGNTDIKITSDGTLSGLVDGDDVTIVRGKAEYDDKNVGTAKAVMFYDFGIKGSDSANYMYISQPASVSAAITAREIRINGTAVKSSKVYDGTAVAEITDIGTLSENFDGENLEITEGTAAYADKNVGKGKTVTFSGFALTGSAARNYTLVSQPADTTADITVKEITINGTTVKSTKVYDGTDVAEIVNVGTPSENYDGDNLTVVKGEAQYDDKNVGTGKAVTFSGFKLSGSEASNYKLTEQPTDATADITRKQITIKDTAVEASKVYDGTVVAEITDIGTLSDNFDGNKLTIVKGEAQYDSKNVGTGKTVTFSGFKLSGSAAGNYELIAQPESTTARITVKELTVANLKVKDKQYDGRNTAEIDGIPTLVGVCDGDTVQLINGTPTFDDINIGKNISVSFTAFVLFGDSTTLGNYKLIQPSGIKASIVEYIANGSEYTVNSNDWINTDFVITAKDGYKLSLTNTADGEWLDTLSASDETSDGKLSFYVKNTETGAVSTVVTEGYKIDRTAPSGEVKLNELPLFKAILSKISFGLFYNSDVNVELTATDDASGIKSVMYYISDKTLTDDEIRTVTDWTENNSFDITAEDAQKFIVYVRIEDNAGNVSYIGSDGATFDTTVPEIHNIENGKTYYLSKKFTAEDENLDIVTVNGDQVSAEFVLKGDTDITYLIRATDKAGNVTEYEVIMKPILSMTEPISSVTLDNVKSSDRDTVTAVMKQLLAVMEETYADGVPEDEWNKLSDTTTGVMTLLKRIIDVADEIERITEAVTAYDIDKVTSADREAIEKLIEDIDVLLSGDNITEQEREELEALRATATALLDRIDAAKAAAESDAIKAVDGITKDNVKLEDKEKLEKAEKALEDALRDFDGNYTEDEHKDLEEKLKRVREALAAIGNAEKAAEEIKKLPSIDDIDPSDKDKLDEVKKIIDGLSENEKNMLGKDVIDSITALETEIARKAAEADKNNSPRTGDESTIALWFVLLLVSGGTATGVAVASKKKKRFVK